MPALLDALDVAVLSSDYEGSPLSVMEYMAAGKPIVSTRVGGVPELVEDGRDGTAGRAARRRGARRARSAGSCATRPRRGDSARRRASASAREYSLDAMVRRIESLYEELWLASPRRRP